MKNLNENELKSVSGGTVYPTITLPKPNIMQRNGVVVFYGYCNVCGYYGIVANASSTDSGSGYTNKKYCPCPICGSTDYTETERRGGGD